MSLLSEPDVVQFRHEYYGLLTRLLAVEPAPELLAALREGIAERAVGAAQVHRLMGEGWRTIGGHLEGHDREAIAEEYTRLFLGPYEEIINPYESYYLTGKLYDAPLADVRGFMRGQSLEPSGDGRAEPEDGLDFELGIMARLVERQLGAGDADPAALVEPQREFLAHHLLVWGPICAQDIVANPAAGFYRGVAQILTGFFEVERDFFAEDGGLTVEPLEEARRRYHGSAFRGPVYDPSQLAEGEPDE